MNQVNLKIRRGNIGFKKYTSTKTEEDLYEIVKLEPNPYYNKEEEYRDNGYIETYGEYSLQKGNHIIDKTLFKNPESCYVLAWLKKSEYGFVLESIMDRLTKLSTEEWNSFIEVYTTGNTFLNKRYF